MPTNASQGLMANILLGPVALGIRLLLLPVVGWLSSIGFGVYNDVTDTYSLQLENASMVLAAGVLWLILVIWGRIAKKFGGST